MRNHFATLGVEERFDLDSEGLEARYRERSREVHPDRFASGSPSERIQSITAATELNEAFRTLKMPVPRAEHLLALRGGAIADNEPVPQDFLVEILELREGLDVAKRGGDAAAVERMETEMRARYDRALARVGELFTAVGQGGDLDAIKRQLVKLRYFQRFLDEVEGEEAA
jgi:molecular chaperone HscB